jgi:hypothetical protein
VDNNAPAPVAPPTAEPRASFWNAHRRRPVFLLLLAAGLILFLILLPAGARALLGMALSAHRELVLLLGLFALLTLSLIWSAGQRLDTRLFLFINLQAHPEWLDRFMGLATQLGNMLTALIAALLLFLGNIRGLAFEIILGTLPGSHGDADHRMAGAGPVLSQRPYGANIFPGNFTQLPVLTRGSGNRRSVCGRGAGRLYPDVCRRTLSTRCHSRRRAGLRLGNSGDARGSVLDWVAFLRGRHADSPGRASHSWGRH